jgi:hypothetical protein
MSSSENSNRVKIYYKEVMETCPAEMDGFIAGLFITQNDAFAYAMTLEDLLLVNDELANPFHKPIVERLIQKLRSCVDIGGFIVYDEFNE